jgi:hypothetical protein
MRNLIHAAVIVLTSSAVHAQVVTHHDDQTVTVRAEGVPIAILLSELARVYPLEKITIEETVQQGLVSVVLETVRPDVALVGILKASGLDFAVSGRRVIVGDWTATGAAIPVKADGAAPETHAVAQAREAAVAAAAAEQQAISEASGTEGDILPTVPVPFIANGENITYLVPNFVPYKMRPEVRALRMATDVAKIP